MVLHKRADKTITTHNKFNLLFVALSILAFEAIVLTLIIVPPATEFELSLHDIYPAWFWIVMGLIILAPLIYLLVTHIVKAKWFSLKTAYWLLSVACTTSVLTRFFSIIRGYHSYGWGDTMPHLAYIVDVLEFGEIIASDPYPYIHVDVTIKSLLTGLSPELATMMLFVFKSAFLIFSYLIIGRRLFKDQRCTIVLVSLIAMPIQAISTNLLSPNELGYCYLCFFLFIVGLACFRNAYEKRFFVLSVIFSIALWFIHPETVVFSTMAIVCTTLACVIYNRVREDKISFNYSSVVLIIFCIVMGWIFFFSYTNGLTSQIHLLENIFLGIGNTEISTYSELKSTTYSFFEIVVLGLLNYGRYLFYCVVAVFITLYLMYYKDGSTRLSILNVSLITIFIVFSIYSLVNMVMGTSSGIHPVRLLKTVMIPPIFLISANIINIFNCKILSAKLLKIFLIVTIVLTLILSIGGYWGNPTFNTYNSPILNQHYSGMELFFETQVDTYLIEETGTSQIRWYNYLYGQTTETPSNIRKYVQLADNPINEHFGYGEYQFLGQQYSDKRYLVQYSPYGNVTRLGGVVITLSDYDESDLIHLNSDKTTLKVQSSGDLSIYIINPLR